MSLAFQRKIVNAAALAQMLREQRAAGRKVVQCHGCFDIVHPGHLRYLQSARRLGDLLVVSLTGDANVSKGPDRPYIPQDLRAENLAALEFVDWVVIDPNPTAADLIALLRPDVYVKGREYASSADPRFLRERELVESYGGRVVFHSGEVVFSSTRLIEGLRDENRLEAWRLHAFCRRCDINPAAVDSVLERFCEAPVLVVGDVIRERYVSCDTSNTADDAPMLALQSIGEMSFWGGAAAVALQLQALGAAPFLLAGVGTDGASQALREYYVGTPSLGWLHEPRLRLSCVAARARPLPLRSADIRLQRQRHLPEFPRGAGLRAEAECAPRPRALSRAGGARRAAARHGAH
ncbi:MAG: adenylyltransferase/cytidyltransferase family protein [Phycisphaerae bacterium]|nr:adenylyltransferase/cytidyltransferase family protein [Phycisphaerae bacterium]